MRERGNSKVGEASRRQKGHGSARSASMAGFLYRETESNQSYRPADFSLPRISFSLATTSSSVSGEARQAGITHGYGSLVGSYLLC